MKAMLASIWRFLNMPKKVQLFIMGFVNDMFLVGVTGVIFNSKNEVLLFKHSYRQTQWSLPGGYLKRGEHPKEGLVREIYEESKMKVKVIKLFRTLPDPETARLDISCYGTYVSGRFEPSAEVTEHGFFHVNELPKISNHQKKLILTIVKKLDKKPQMKNKFLERLFGQFEKNKSYFDSTYSVNGPM